MRTASLTKVLAAAVSNNICLSQTPGVGAGSLVINGAAAAGGVATLDTQRVVGLTSAGNLSAATFTITGTNDDGATISESLAGPNANTVSTVNNYKTVSSITFSAGPGAVALTVGTTGVGASKPIVLDQYISPFNPAFVAEVTGTVNYDVQYTYDDLFDPAGQGSLNWFSIAALTAQTTTKDSALTAPVSGVRVKINSGAGSVKLIAKQPGIGGL